MASAPIVRKMTPGTLLMKLVTKNNVQLPRFLTVKCMSSMNHKQAFSLIKMLTFIATMEIFCAEPGIIENGKRTNSWRVVFEFNEVVTYTCDPSDGPQEYSLVGESKLSCSGPGQWSSDPPQCKVVQCEPPVLKYGKPLSEMKEKFSYKDEVAFECLKGFYLNGSNPVFCGGNSTWEPEMPTCIKGKPRDKE
ncbi:membrane cofactor protein-like [Myotis lucifugus]|uniref:membrane cofactor protein-like n=1 Tax=Myotis lucifugus TaxID=59463 RepID=UPI000CCC5B7D|nr:membrane cofactor protein-like [Myotis lucifugus]